MKPPKPQIITGKKNNNDILIQNTEYYSKRNSPKFNEINEIKKYKQNKHITPKKETYSQEDKYKPTLITNANLFNKRNVRKPEKINMSNDSTFKKMPSTNFKFFKGNS